MMRFFPLFISCLLISCLLISCSASRLPSAEKIKSENYQEVRTQEMPLGDLDSYPMYPDGLNGLARDLAEATVYPKEAKTKGITGRVVLEFVVNTQGRIENVKIFSSTNSIFNKNSIKAASRLKRWIPGKQNSEYVKVRLRQPLRFQLN